MSEDLGGGGTYDLSWPPSSWNCGPLGGGGKYSLSGGLSRLENSSSISGISSGGGGGRYS